MKHVFFILFILMTFPTYGQWADTAMGTGQQQAVRVTDTAGTTVTNASAQTRKINIVKKDIKYSTFTKLAIGMMAFIALIYVTSQNYNPSE